MSGAVHKYLVPMQDAFTLAIPGLDAEILSFHWQPDVVQVGGGAFQVWALVAPEGEPLPRRFRLAGTGHPVEPTSGWRFIGTAMTPDGRLVMHLWETP